MVNTDAPRGPARQGPTPHEHHAAGWDEPGSSWERVRQHLESGELRRVRVTWADQHGVSRCKVVTASAFRGVARDGLRTNVGTLIGDTAGAIVFDPFTAGGGLGRSEMTGAPDVVVVPDPRTFTLLPWSPGSGWITGNLEFPGGEPLPYSTRGLLGKAVAAAAAQGFEALVGIEMEFHLTRLDPQAGPRSAGGMGSPGSATAVLPTSSGYQHQAEADIDEVDDLLRVLQDDLEGLGLPLRTLESELGPSQFEVTFDPLPAMRAADTAFLFRTATKQLAKRHGYHVTFMSRPLLPGAFSSGWHLHLSLTDALTGRNLFVPDEDGQLLSSLGRHFTAGILTHARESAVLTTPTVTGFKRFRINSLAPDRANWGSDQRGAMIRVSGVDKDPNTHIENRVGDPSANPYLYVASQLLSGLDGLRRGEEPPDPTDEPYQTQAPSLPSSLGEAVDEFANSDFYRQVAGTEFVDFYAAHKRSEYERFTTCDTRDQGDPSNVGDWEHREYFDLH